MYYSIPKRIRRLRYRLMTWLEVVRSSAYLRLYYPAHICLTYASVDGWSRNDIRVFLQRLRKYFHRRGWKFVYFWVAELQERGAVHYHLVVFVPKGHKLPKPDQAGWWRHGFTSIGAVSSFIGYFSKYLQKVDPQGLGFPRRLRLFGYGGLDVLEKAFWRVFWLPRRLRGRISDVVGLCWLVLKRLHHRLQLLLSDSGEIVWVVFRPYPLDPECIEWDYEILSVSP